MAAAELSRNEARFRTVVSILIAVVSIIGAFVAWRLATAAGEAGGEDTAGLTATLNREQADVLGDTDVYREYAAYSIYQKYNQLGDLIAEDQRTLVDDPAVSEEAYGALDRQKREAWDLAIDVQGLFFDTRFLKPEDGSFDIERRRAEAAVGYERNLDLDPEAHFDNADDARLKARWLAGALIVLALSLLTYTVARKAASALRLYAAGLASVLLTVGVVAAMATELTL